MDFIQGENREQFQLLSLEVFISQDNTVGFVVAIRTIKTVSFSKPRVIPKKQQRFNRSYSSANPKHLQIKTYFSRVVQRPLLLCAVLLSNADVQVR